MACVEYAITTDIGRTYWFKTLEDAQAQVKIWLDQGSSFKWAIREVTSKVVQSA